MRLQKKTLRRIEKKVKKHTGHNLNKERSDRPKIVTTERSLFRLHTVLCIFPGNSVLPKFCNFCSNLYFLAVYGHEKKFYPKFKVKSKKKIFTWNLFLISRFLSPNHL